MIYQNKREQTRERIENAFLLLYRERDIGQISVREICSKAHINRSTFYTYYLDAHDLLEKIENRVLEDITGRVKPVILEMKEVDANYLLKVMIMVFQESDNLPALLIRRGSGELIDRISQIAGKLFCERLGTLEEPVRQKLDLCIRYHVTGLSALFDSWEQHYRDKPVTEVLELLTGIANRGVITVMHEEIR
jgi:AcrR family transcriptional regulator